MAARAISGVHSDHLHRAAYWRALRAAGLALQCLDAAAIRDDLVRSPGRQQFSILRANQGRLTPFLRESIAGRAVGLFRG